MKTYCKVSIYDDASIEIINQVAEEIRLGLLKESGYMLENVPWRGLSYSTKIENLKEDFACALAFQRDVYSKLRYHLSVNALPLPSMMNVSVSLNYGEPEKLYNFLTSEEAKSKISEKLRKVLLRAEDWRRDRE